MRFNGAPVKGYEDKVGKYFTHWCCNFVETTYLNIEGFPIQEIFSTDLKTHPNMRWESLHTAPITYIPEGYLGELVGKYAPSFYRPSSGLRLLWWIYKATGQKINRERIFGMDCFKDDDNAMGKDYHSIRKHAQKSPRHRPEKERAILNEIIT